MSDPHSSRTRSNLIRKLAYEENAAFVAGMDAVSMDKLRRAFAPMFDRAAHAVEAAGYAQDDSVVLRLIRCRNPAGHEWMAEAESLSDRERLSSCLLDAAKTARVEIKTVDEIELRELRVEAYIECWGD